MNWITTSWPMAIAACLTLAVIHLQIAVRMRSRAQLAHLFFACSAVAVGATGVFEILLLHTGDLEEYRRLMFWAQFPISAMLLSFTGFVWYYFESARKGPAIASAGLTLACLAGHIFLPMEMHVRYADAIREVHTFGGVQITLGVIRNGWLSYIEIASVLSLVALTAESSILAWKQGNRQRAAMVGGGLVFFLTVTRGYALLVETGVLQTPFFFIFPILALLAAMGRQLSLDVFRAAKLSDALEENERRMDMATRAVNLGLWEWHTPSGDFWVTPITRSLLGTTIATPVDFDLFAERIHPDDRNDFIEAAEKAKTEGGEFAIDCRVSADTGAREKWIHIRGRLDSDKASPDQTLRGIVADITERKEAQLKADDLRSELTHVTRVSTMGELAASLAHELNQPLAAILSNAQAARRILAVQDTDLQEIREILDDIIKDDKRAGEVIHRLRALIQKKEHVHAERVDLNELVHDAERLLSSERTVREVDLVLRLEKHLPPVWAGRVELQQVLLNLMVNAMDAMSEVPAGQRQLTIESRSNEKTVSIIVRDVGPGIPDAIRAQIFHPFFTTKTSGLGMGLAISRSILEAYNGQLRFENIPSGGAAFAIEFEAMSE